MQLSSVVITVLALLFSWLLLVWIGIQITILLKIGRRITKKDEIAFLGAGIGIDLIWMVMVAMR